jgi:hypothetical protein
MLVVVPAAVVLAVVVDGAERANILLWSVLDDRGISWISVSSTE